LTEAFVGQLGYLGIALVLVLGGLGLPIPEEAPIILAAILSKSERMWWPLALGSCLAGVLVGDFLVYFLGYVYGERVMSLRLTRKFLSRAREVQIQGYFHRHGFKILILGRFAVGFRTAAYLTAGILKLPALRLFLTDLFAASLSTCLMFGLGYFFAHWIQTTLDRAKYWLTAGVAVALAGWLLYRYYKGRQRAGQPVGPRVLESNDIPLPPDDLHAYSGEFRAPGVALPAPAPVSVKPSAAPAPPPSQTIAPDETPCPPPRSIVVAADADRPAGSTGAVAPVPSEHRPFDAPDSPGRLGDFVDVSTRREGPVSATFGANLSESRVDPPGDGC
jgi:membrane protein DedA with SNARE-associated domain